MIIDDDDKYIQREAFTTLFNEAEKYNLDILGFKTILSSSFDDKGEFNNTKNVESRIIYQNELSDYMFSKGNNGINENNTNIKVNQLIKTALFLKIIKQIDVKYYKII